MEIQSHKGVMIYFNHRQGDFYCNIGRNTPHYSDKTHNSKRYEGIIKAINNAESVTIEAQTVLEIVPMSGLIKEHTIIAKKGNMYIFKSGRTSDVINRHANMFFKSVTESKEWSKFKALANEYEAIRDEQSDAYRRATEAYRKLHDIIKLFSAHKLK